MENNNSLITAEGLLLNSKVKYKELIIDDIAQSVIPIKIEKAKDKKFTQELKDLYNKKITDFISEVFEKYINVINDAENAEIVYKTYFDYLELKDKTTYEIDKIYDNFYKDYIIQK